jgi:SAM-dependent methyltransferase
VAGGADEAFALLERELWTRFDQRERTAAETIARLQSELETLRAASGASTPRCGGAPGTKRVRGEDHRAPPSATHPQVFSDIYARDYWRLGGESRSGPGSRRETTIHLRGELPRLLSRLRIRHLLDLGCGDFNWMRETELPVERYIGVDVVFEIVAENRLRHGGPGRQFLYRDLMRHPLPRAELVICRDVLIHFPDEDLVTALDAILASGARYLLTTTFVARERNEPIELGDWRPVNLQLPPLSLPPPIDAIRETPDEPGFEDKRLGLWDLDVLRDGAG